MICRELIGLLDDYIDGNLPSSQRDAIERHLAGCMECAMRLARYRNTLRLCKAAFNSQDDTLPSGIPGDLIDAILAALPTS